MLPGSCAVGRLILMMRELMSTPVDGSQKSCLFRKSYSANHYQIGVFVVQGAISDVPVSRPSFRLAGPLSTMRTRSATLRASSFSIMRARCTSIVRGLIPSRRPASLLEAPLAIYASTSRSRGVSRWWPEKSSNTPLLATLALRLAKVAMALPTRSTMLRPSNGFTM